MKLQVLLDVEFDEENGRFPESGEFTYTDENKVLRCASYQVITATPVSAVALNPQEPSDAEQIHAHLSETG